MPKIKAITDPAFRTGEGAKGAWSLMQIQTDDGKTATIFSPASVGDEVTLVYNDKYKNYSATKVKPNLNSPAPSNDALERIEGKLDQLLFKVNGLKNVGVSVSGSSVVKTSASESKSTSDREQQPTTDDLPPVDNYDEGSPF